MKELDQIVRASVRVILARRDAKRATQDGASEQAQKRYGAAFSKALDDLEKAVDAFAKVPKPDPAKPAGAGAAATFDWMGAFRAVQAVVRAAKRVRKGHPVEDIIEGEIVG